MAEVNFKPELRFPEFKGEWKNQTLFEVAKITTGNTPSTSKQEYYNGEFFFVSPADLNDGRYVVRTQTTLSELGFNSGRRISKGSTLFVSIGSTIGKVGQTVCDVITNQQINALEANELNSDDFIYSLLFKYGPKIRLLAGNQAVPILNKTDFSNLKFFFPEKEEQQKIASFLTAIDERIQLLQKKKAKLEEYKKGVMQQLFSQQIRFKDEKGNDFQDWEEKKLGEICEKQSSNISANSLGESEGNFKIYGATGFLQFVDFYREEEPYISIVKDGAGVGRILLCDAKSSVLGTLDILRPKEENNIKFLYALISNIRFEKYITGSTIPHIYFKDYSKEKINVPVPAEQQKIADFLTSLDNSIESIGVEIDGSIEYKKGLLQKMFV